MTRDARASVERNALTRASPAAGLRGVGAPYFAASGNLFFNHA